MCTITSDRKSLNPDKSSRKRLWWSLALITIWVGFSGIGLLAVTDGCDHEYRDAIFRDLVKNTWPVEGETEGVPERLCYYFGFWLPAAGVAKITGSLIVGFLFQWFYALAGTIIALLMVFRHVGKVSVVVTLIFMFWGGWDVVAWFLFDDICEHNFHNFLIKCKEHSYLFYSHTHQSILIYFIYNQGVAIWLAIMLLLKQKDRPEALAVPLALLAPFSPIVCGALTPAVIAGCLRKFPRGISVANVGAALTGTLLLLFYLQNERSGGVSFLNLRDTWPRFLGFLVLSYGVYMPFVWNSIRRNWIFWILFATMIPMTFVLLDGFNDVAWRCTIPSTTLMMLMVMKKVVSIRNWRRPINVLFAAVIIIGMWDGVNLMAVRSVRTLVRMRHGGSMHDYQQPTIFRKAYFHDSFVATGDSSIYVKYLMPTRDSKKK